MRLVDLAVDRPVATLMLTVSLGVLGAVSVFRLPLGFMPAVDVPRLEVEIDAPGLTPADVLREIVVPIEDEVGLIPGVRRLRSRAHPGRASVRADFDWSANMRLAQLDVREAVERARPLLPADVSRTRVRAGAAGPGAAILEGRVAAERDLGESFDLLDRRVRRPLERVRGISRVDLDGVAPPEVQVAVDVAGLRAHGLSVADLVRRLDAANVEADAGVLRDGALRLDVRATGRLRDLEDFRGLALGVEGVRLGDVAAVSFGEPRLDYGRHLDGRFAIGVTAYKEPWANTVETAALLRERIAGMADDPELRGISVLVWYDAGEEIRRSLAGLRDAGLIGGALAVVVLLLFLRRLRTTLVVAAAIPFSLLVTAGGLLFLGGELNILTLLGLMLGVGLLVDNAVVVMENIHRLEGTGMPAAAAARQGAREVLLAVVAATATTVVVWGWLFVVPRDEMVIMVGQVALSICLAVTASLLVSLTFVPLAASRWAGTQPPRGGWLAGRVVPAYRRLLRFSLRHRLPVLLVLAAVAAAVVVPFQALEKTSYPRIHRRDVFITYEIHEWGTKEAFEAHVNHVEAWLETRREDLGLEHVYSWFGERLGAGTIAYLRREDASEERLRRLREAVKSELPPRPGVSFHVLDRDRQERPDAGRRTVMVALRGEDPDYLRSLAFRVAARLAALDDVTAVRGPDDVGQREVRLRVHPEAVRAAGLTPAGLAEAVGFALHGRSLRRFQSESGESPVTVTARDETLPGLSALPTLPVPRGGGESVPLGALVEPETGRSPAVRTRENRALQESAFVDFDPAAVSTEEARRRVSEAVADLDLPPGYSWDFGHAGRQHDEGLAVMATGVGLALLVVCLLMAALFESLSQPLAVVVTLPLAFTGAAWALWLTGHELDILAYMGLIILVGIVVNNGIVMVDRVNQLRSAGRERVDALVEGCGDRLRPVLMTAITTTCGMLPLALTGPTVAGAYIDSLAVAVIGGLATSTLVTLVALPVWYSLIEDLGSVLLRLLPRRAAG